MGEEAAKATGRGRDSLGEDAAEGQRRDTGEAPMTTREP